MRYDPGQSVDSRDAADSKAGPYRWSCEFISVHSDERTDGVLVGVSDPVPYRSGRSVDV